LPYKSKEGNAHDNQTIRNAGDNIKIPFENQRKVGKYATEHVNNHERERYPDHFLVSVDLEILREKCHREQHRADNAKTLDGDVVALFVGRPDGKHHPCLYAAQDRESEYDHDNYGVPRSSLVVIMALQRAGRWFSCWISGGKNLNDTWNDEPDPKTPKIKSRTVVAAR
jgi:hypothetical protein